MEVEDERKEKYLQFPMLKSVCAVHSSALTFKDLCKEVTEVDVLVRKLSVLSTFFQISAARTTELEKIAEKHSLKVRHLPKYFEIRWSEFTFALVDAVLISWKSLIKYCSESKEEQANGFRKMLTNKDDLQLMCFLVDVLLQLRVFKKRLQLDDLTVVDIVPETTKFIKKLQKFDQRTLPGDWEESSNNELD